MEKISFLAESEKRIDVVVSEAVPEISRSYAKKLIDGEMILVNGKAVKSSFKTSVGDKVEIEFEELQPITAVPEDIPIEIIYEDDSVLVVNKERGMVVHPAVGNEKGTLVNAVLYHCKDNLSGINGDLRPGIVHRIDKDTTGLLVVAKNDLAHKSLTEQLAERSLSRVYYALVNGNIKEDKGTIDAPIDRSKTDRKQMAVSKDGRTAVTHFEVLERFGNYTFIKCVLQTGRTHQIRVHMKYMGHSIVGDKTYGIKNERFNLEGQLLHAGEIKFIHPSSGEEKKFTCPIPKDFENVLTVLRNKNA